ncbi:MAG: SDR family oxidoreductase [Candidatus Rokubacteria bacterium]|nr:SDR family oxidoreductase [Candidatus Rokubacteria bacterium]
MANPWRSGLLVAVRFLGLAGPAPAAEDRPRQGGELLFIMPAADPPSSDAHREDTFAVIQPAAPHYLPAQAVLPGMRERGWGRVITTSSIGSLGNIGQANYAASKAGVIGLTKTLALEYAKYGVTVNCIAPGATMTSMLAGVPDKIKEQIIAKIPVGRIADPSEIAAVHCFLASDEAAFITGQVLFVDGGMTVGI